MIRSKVYCAAVIMVLGLLCAPAGAFAQKLVFVVRHAERADDGTSMMHGRPDPSLSAAGAARAARLAQMLADSNIKGIYVTEYRRTQETAKPLAAKLGIELRQVDSADIAGLLRRLRDECPADVVLVVGHSNTVPGILKALGGDDVKIADDEYDNLFLIVPRTGTMTRIRFRP